MKDLSKSVLETISQKKIRPFSKWYFLGRKSVLWGVFGVTLLLGSVSVSVWLLQFIRNPWFIGRTLYTSFPRFLFETFPYFWFLLFLFFILVLVWQFRKTPKGYKHGVVMIFLLNISLSVIFGFVLYHAGIALSIHQRTQAILPHFIQNNFGQEHMWEHSEQGLLSGLIQKVDLEQKRMQVQDARMNIWSVDFSRVVSPQLLLVPSRRVKMIGEVEPNHFFIASHVFPGNFRMIEDDFPKEFRQRMEGMRIEIQQRR